MYTIENPKEVAQFFCQNPSEGQDFSGKILRGVTILGFIAFLLTSFWKIGRGGGSCFITPSYPTHPLSFQINKMFRKKTLKNLT
jgi:hypothetical protein